MPTLSLRSGLLSLLVTLVFTIPACSSGGDVSVVVAPPPPPPLQTVATVTVLLSPPQLAVGQTGIAAAVARDANNNIVNGLPITWSTTNAATATVSPAGVVTAIANGSVAITANMGGSQGTAQLLVSQPGTITEEALAGQMLTFLPNKIQNAIAAHQDMLPRNANLAPQIQAAIEKLQRPGLAQDIRQNNLVATATVTSINGRPIPIVAVFTQPDMRPRVERAVEQLRRVMPAMEEFMGAPYPLDSVKVWYGFGLLTNSELNLEDENDYLARTPMNRLLPHEGMVAHELTHSMMGHEGLNQFLEIYTSNLIRHQSTRVEDWTHTRFYVAGANSSQTVHLLIDIYKLIGIERMKTAYRRLFTLKPRYGSLLSAEGKQAFIDAAAESERDAVSALAQRITY